jgi:hypothetical protein
MSGAIHDICHGLGGVAQSPRPYYIWRYLNPSPTIRSEKRAIDAPLRLLQTRSWKLRGPRADIWLTVSAWLWAAYFAALAVTASWLLL